MLSRVSRAVASARALPWSRMATVAAVATVVVLAPMASPFRVSQAAATFSVGSDRTGVTHIDAAELRRMIAHKDAHHQFMIVDVRNPLELMIRGPIPGAINVPLDSIDAFFGPDATDALWKAKFDRSKPHHGDRIVFYCAAGRRSLVAAHRAQDLGFSIVSSLDGGISGWH